MKRIFNIRFWTFGGWFTWVAAGVAVVGGVTSAVSANQASKQSTLPANDYNAYGQVNTPNTGAITSMNNIFDTLNGGALNNQAQTASQTYAGALNNAANSPQLNAASDYAANEIAGNYLNSPTVNNYANQAYNSIISQGANQNARTQANFANNGIGFSTGMQQAQQAGNAATANQAATTKAGILSQNYQAERQLQQGAVGIQEGLVAQPSQYLSQVNNALYAPYSTQAGLTTGLLGNSVSSPQPTYVQQPNLGQAIGTGVSSAQGLYSLYNGIQQQQGGGNSGNIGGGGVTPTFTDPTTGGLVGPNGFVECWVAREVFGADNPKWLQFRDWMLNRAPEEFRRLYLKFGPEWALVVRNHPEFKPGIAAWMESKISA